MLDGAAGVDWDKVQIDEFDTVTELKIDLPADMDWTQSKKEMLDKIVDVEQSMELSGHIDEYLSDNIPTHNELEVLHLNGVLNNAFTDNTLPKFITKQLLITNSAVRGMKFQKITNLAAIKVKCENAAHVPEPREILNAFGIDLKLCTLLQDKWFGKGLREFEKAGLGATLLTESGHTIFVRKTAMDISITPGVPIGELKTKFFAGSEVKNLILRGKGKDELDQSLKILKRFKHLKYLFIDLFKSEGIERIEETIKSLDMKQTFRVYFTQDVLINYDGEAKCGRYSHTFEHNQ